MEGQGREGWEGGVREKEEKEGGLGREREGKGETTESPGTQVCF